MHLMSTKCGQCIAVIPSGSTTNFLCDILSWNVEAIEGWNPSGTVEEIIGDLYEKVQLSDGDFDFFHSWGPESYFVEMTVRFEIVDKVLVSCEVVKYHPILEEPESNFLERQPADFMETDDTTHKYTFNLIKNIVEKKVLDLEETSEWERSISWLEEDVLCANGLVMSV